MTLVTTEDRGTVRHVILNRADKRNAFNFDLVRATGDALLAAANDPDVRCVVIRGDGAVFSSGMDVKELASLSGSPQRLREFRRECILAWNLAEEMTKPTIAQIHGVCFGGALELALACDLRVVAEDARLSIPEVRLGLVPDVGGSSRLPAIVGLGRAKELVMTGREFDADEAFRIGFANRVAPAAELDATTTELTEQLTRGFAVPIGLSKRILDAAAKPALALTLELEVTAQEVAVAALSAAMRDAAAEQ
ncbi:MAG: enoyl-CoA hydratase/isomerase family protein [Thermoleophilia bacterium]|nr:enoyl-CoA hydratase/isomerase family protein [Thermoleophilia bacterium]